MARRYLAYPGPPDAAMRSRMSSDLLGHRLPDGTVDAGPYKKWQGPHWTLYSLAAIGHPRGDASLGPMLQQVHRWLFSREHARPPSTTVLPGQADRVRSCASMEGNAIWYSLRLGLADESTDVLAMRIMARQWPDGGWNCDRRPQARSSSVQETLLPLRGLGLYAASGRVHAAQAAGTVDRAAEFLLARRLLAATGEPIRPDWGGDPLLIHHPIAFYDVLHALLVMAEIGRIHDPRCADALAVLAAKQRPDGGFPAELRTATTAKAFVSRGTFADWGPMGRRRSNPLVSAAAQWTLQRSQGLL